MNPTPSSKAVTSLVTTAISSLVYDTSGSEGWRDAASFCNLLGGNHSLRRMPYEISVVVPLYNEADNVAPLVTRIRDALGGQARSWELVLVDDCSSDGTWLRICEEQKRERRLHPLRHLVNLGQSAALWTGFRHTRAPLIATLDGDLQNDPVDLPRMLQELECYDMVCGVRVRRADTWVRRASSHIARWARSAALGTRFTDTGCNLRVFRRDVLVTLPAFNGIHRFMPIFAERGGARVLEVPVCHHARTAGISKYGVWNRLGRGVCDLLMVALYMRRQLKLLAESELLQAADLRAPGRQHVTAK